MGGGGWTSTLFVYVASERGGLAGRRLGLSYSRGGLAGRLPQATSRGTCPPRPGGVLLLLPTTWAGFVLSSRTWE